MSELFRGRWPALLLACLLLAVSTVSKLQIGRLELTGGAVFATLAALVVLWPRLQDAMKRGGSAEFMGLKVQVEQLEETAAKLERTAESDLGLQIAGLRGDVEELRARVGEAVSVGTLASKVIADVDASGLEAAIAEYRAHPDTDDWRPRSHADKRLAAGAGRLPVSVLTEKLKQSRSDQETSMAVAVCLGLSFPGDDDQEAARLLKELVVGPFERARFRAAKSIELRLRRLDTSPHARAILHEAVTDALRFEPAEVVREALMKAREAF